MIKVGSHNYKSWYQTRSQTFWI